ncbi:MAG: sulfotransferase [Flavobacteriales bacterium]|nr:sulfotransferase [Flavobacteriales bacterium]
MDLIGIHGVPRSGTSWLAQIFRSSPSVLLRFQPLFSYAFKDRLSADSGRVEILRFFEELRDTKDSFVLQKDPNIHVEYPEFEEHAAATHLVYKEVRYNHILRNLTAQVPELKLIGLVRHPCAVIDSWVNAPREFKPEWSVEEQWRSGALKNQGRPEECFRFDKWEGGGGVVRPIGAAVPQADEGGALRRTEPRPGRRDQDLFHLLAHYQRSTTEQFIHSSRSKQGSDANSIYRKIRPDTAWESRLPKAIADTILTEIADSALARFLI